MSRFRVLLAALTAAAFLCGLAVAVSPADPPAASTAAGEPRARAVRDLLDRRARAVLARDEAAFTADLDPAADAGFRQRQHDLFRNLAAVPLDGWEYRLAGDGDLGGVRPPAADESWAPELRLAYRLRGVDATPSTQVMAYLFTRRGDRWYLNSDTALEPAGRRTWRGPWDFGPCHVLTGAGGFVLGHPGSEPLAARVLAELDTAVAAVTEVWGPSWTRRVAVLIPADARELQALVGPAFADGTIAGVAVADRVDAGTRTAQGQRVVLNRDSASALSPLSLRVLLRHEITHVAARGETADGAPLWLLEGFADYVGHRDGDVPPRRAAPALAERVRTAPPTGLPPDARFQGGDRELAYQESWSFHLYLARRLGEPRLVETYRRVAGAGRVTDERLDALVREATGVGVEELVRGWREFLPATFP
ncbi:basic secretory family protein [Saccharothrix australiensis]|uniref:Basic secretory peptidase family protein n=1 Tax=Saccharothrix australiensis TaxID=2072 RepID=A0A495VXH5_9PSEU|nr:basic secretory family protein [Saccharothrix australiensis]RKT53293.1 hypothetical protein C8E97_1852 [Saccharothrix australiensis]